MVKDNQMTGAMESPAPRGVKLGTAMVAMAVAAVLTVVAVLVLRGFLKVEPSLAAPPNNENDKPAEKGQVLFRDWPDPPEFTLLLSGQQHGYVLPCGCSSPQKGGLERRFNFLKRLDTRGWPVVSLDLGDIPQMYGPANLPNHQQTIKYAYSMRALKKMDYAAVGIGEYETAVPLEVALAEFALNEEQPRVLAGNLKAKGNLIDPTSTATTFTVNVPKRSTKVGIISVVGASVAKKIKHNQLSFDTVKDVLPGLIERLDKQTPNLKVLLYQGSGEEAKKLAEKFPVFNVILCLDDTDEPSASPINAKDPTAKNTMIVAVGHKGKHVGLVGFYPKVGAPNSFDMRYQMVTLDEDFLTPKKERDNHPIVKLMEQYTKQLKDEKYLERYKPVLYPLPAMEKPPTNPPSYAGTEACMKCHDHAYTVWKDTPHAHAYKTLVDTKWPGNRQFDAECIVCHTVGFGYNTGFPAEAPGPKDTKRKLTDVGCESCHGPCSEHVKNSGDEKWHKVINPYKHVDNEKPADKAIRKRNMDLFCQKCHDSDNDVHWDFDVKWPKIIHHTP